MPSPDAPAVPDPPSDSPTAPASPAPAAPAPRRAPPQLPDHIDQWSVRLLAQYLGLNYTTVYYHVRQVVRQRGGHCSMDRTQAQRVVSRIYSFGHRDARRRLRAPSSAAPRREPPTAPSKSF